MSISPRMQARHDKAVARNARRAERQKAAEQRRLQREDASAKLLRAEIIVSLEDDVNAAIAHAKRNFKHGGKMEATIRFAFHSWGLSCTTYDRAAALIKVLGRVRYPDWDIEADGHRHHSACRIYRITVSHK